MLKWREKKRKRAHCLVFFFNNVFFQVSYALSMIIKQTLSLRTDPFISLDMNNQSNDLDLSSSNRYCLRLPTLEVVISKAKENNTNDMIYRYF